MLSALRESTVRRELFFFFFFFFFSFFSCILFWFWSGGVRAEGGSFFAPASATLLNAPPSCSSFTGRGDGGDCAKSGGGQSLKEPPAPIAAVEMARAAWSCNFSSLRVRGAMASGEGKRKERRNCGRAGVRLDLERQTGACVSSCRGGRALLRARGGSGYGFDFDFLFGEEGDVDLVMGEGRRDAVLDNPDVGGPAGLEIAGVGHSVVLEDKLSDGELAGLGVEASGSSQGAGEDAGFDGTVVHPDVLVRV